MAKLIIGADLVPTASNQELFAKADVDALLGVSLRARLRAADYRLFNLETPLVDAPSPIDKCGPSLLAPTDTVRGIKALGADLLSLANNHIMDNGEQGLYSTMDALTANKIAFFGAGKKLSEASKPALLRVGEKTLGILACVDPEFSNATEGAPGANPFDPLETPDQVNALKARCDFVIVLYHGGKEFYRYPSPGLQKICRKFVDKGADLVITQHCHCIGCREEYRQGTIVYGQGNFLFDDEENEYEATSLLIEVDNEGMIHYLPIMKHGNSVRIAEGKDADNILRAFDERSEAICQPGFLEKEFQTFAASYREHYLLCLHGTNRKGFFYRLMNRLTTNKWKSWIVRHAYNKQTRLTIWNYVTTEAHRELLLKGLQSND